VGKQPNGARELMRARFALLLLAALACSRPTAAPREQPAATPSATSTSAPAPAAKPAPTPAVESDFTPPDARGWGSAAGLRYLALTRGGAKANAPLPMLIAVHGLGDRPRPEWFAGLDVPARLVLPQAPMPHHGGFAWFEYRVRDQDPQALARGIANATTRLARAIELLVAKLPTLGKPVIAGFSQGGMLSYALALEHPALFEAAVPISGMLPASAWPKQKKPNTRYPPIRAVHGGADDVVPDEMASALAKHLRARGFDAQLTLYPGIGHAISPAMWNDLGTTVTEALTTAAKSAKPPRKSPDSK
jgi:phospholipase/carboxylesterase